MTTRPRQGRGEPSDGSTRLRERALTVFLVLEVLVLFVAAPLAALGFATPLFGGTVAGVPFFLIIVIISRNSWAAGLTILAVCLAVGGAIMRIREPTPLNIWFSHSAVIIGILAISIVMGRIVFGPGRVTHNRIEGGIVLYLNIAVAFTAAYRLIAELDPGAFTAIVHGQSEAAMVTAMLYFSFTTLTSTGFGEILPVHPIARSLANLESVMGQLYVAVFLARLVSLHVGGNRA
jgi:hypothetical protein